MGNRQASNYEFFYWDKQEAKLLYSSPTPNLTLLKARIAEEFKGQKELAMVSFPHGAKPDEQTQIPIRTDGKENEFFSGLMPQSGGQFDVTFRDCGLKYHEIDDIYINLAWEQLKKFHWTLRNLQDSAGRESEEDEKSELFIGVVNNGLRYSISIHKLEDQNVLLFMIDARKCYKSMMEKYKKLDFVGDIEVPDSILLYVKSLPLSSIIAFASKELESMESFYCDVNSIVVTAFGISGCIAHLVGVLLRRELNFLLNSPKVQVITASTPFFIVSDLALKQTQNELKLNHLTIIDTDDFEFFLANNLLRFYELINRETKEWNEQELKNCQFDLLNRFDRQAKPALDEKLLSRIKKWKNA
jgi:hypothetical protein